MKRLMLDRANARNPFRRTGVIPAVAMAMSAASSGVAAPVSVYGGPAYDVASGGYVAPTLPIAPGRSASNGSGIGNATARDAAGRELGMRAVRWDALGNAAELDRASDGTSIAFAMNSVGRIVGAADSDVASGAVPQAVMWQPGVANRFVLGNINANNLGASTAYAINDAGAIAGFADRYDAMNEFRGPRAVRWNSGGIATALDAIDTDDNGNAASAGYAINAAGTVVGIGVTVSSTLSERAVRWDAGTTNATLLGTLNLAADGAGSLAAVAINDVGTAVGYAQQFNAAGDAFLGNRAVRWDAGTTAAVELDTLGTDGVGNGNAMANGINASGDIVGSATKYDLAGNDLGGRATRWDAGQTAAIELGSLEGVTLRSEAYAINIAGAAVGYIELEVFGTTDRRSRAVMWDDAGLAYDLNAFIAADSFWTLTRAAGIDDRGWITGVGLFDPDGLGPIAAYDRLFLVQLPEPTTGTAVMSAMLMLTLRRRSARLVPSPGSPGEG